MDRRVPSLSSAVGRLSRSNIRHRSGAFDSAVRDGDSESTVQRRSSLSEHSERTNHTLTVQVEDMGDPERHAPTVLLIRRSKVSSRSSRSRYKPLPGLPSDSGDGEHLGDFPHVSYSPPGREHDELQPPAMSTPTILESNHHDTFSPVPLTPRPPQPERGASDMTVYNAGMNSNSAGSFRLPTPDYTAGGGAGGGASRGLSSYFPRMPSFRLQIRRPAPPRTDSEGSTYSHMSDDSTAISHASQASGRSRFTACMPVQSREPMSVPGAIKDKRPMLVSAFSTTDKFTQKFPRPRTMRGLSGSAGATASLPEEGEGLGLERVDRWTVHKWCLVFSVCTVLVYGAAGLVCALLTWFRAWRYADVMYIADYDILVLLTLASSILLFTALVGLSGALLNSRPLLAVYALLLWPALFSMLAIGYPAYKRYTFALDRKLSRAWSEWYTPLGRRVVQDVLACCGFLTPMHAAAPSARCYPRSPLPGCKGALWRAERATLATVWSTVFALVPVHIANVFVALLCANHVTRTFGKGITPKRYRLTAEDVRADAELLRKVAGGAGMTSVARPGYVRAGSSGMFREDKASY